MTKMKWLQLLTQVKANKACLDDFARTARMHN